MTIWSRLILVVAILMWGVLPAGASGLDGQMLSRAVAMQTGIHPGQVCPHHAGIVRGLANADPCMQVRADGTGVMPGGTATGPMECPRTAAGTGTGTGCDGAGSCHLSLSAFLPAVQRLGNPDTGAATAPKTSDERESRFVAPDDRPPRNKTNVSDVA